MSGFLPGIGGAQTFPSANSGSSLPAPLPQDVLTDLNSSQDARNLAALQLIAPKDASAHSAVLDLFRNGPDPSKLALAQALGTISWPDPDFKQPLMELLSGRDPATAEAAATALAQYNDDPQVMQTLIDQARPGGRSDDIRLAVIRATGTC